MPAQSSNPDFRLPRAALVGSGNVQGQVPSLLLASALLLQVLKMELFVPSSKKPAGC